MNNKEFDRSVCFQFYESYLEQGKLVKEQLGSEMCAEYFIALARYGLYQEESDNPMVKMIITGLKNTIDAGQSKRERAFDRKNTDQTESILQYKREHPEATQIEIADACKCSVGKVNKVINSNLNNNINNNSNSNLNSNSNNNSVNVNVNKEEEREIKDLTEEEAKEIIDMIRKRVRYPEIQKKYNLKYGLVTKDFEQQWNDIKIEREHEQKEKYFQDNQNLYKELSNYWGHETRQRMNLHYQDEQLKQYSVNDIVIFLRNRPEYRIDGWKQKYGNDYYSDGYSKHYRNPYKEYLISGLKANLLS